MNAPDSNELVLFPQVDLSGVTPFPYRSRLSFGPLIRYVESLRAKCDNAILRSYLDGVVEGARTRPELREPLSDPAAFERNADFIRAAMALVVTESSAENECVAAIVPFMSTGFLASRSFQRAFLAGGFEFQGRQRGSARRNALLRNAHWAVFDKVFGKRLGESSRPEALFDVTDRETGLDRVHTFRLNPKFVDVVVAEGFKLPTTDVVDDAWRRFLAGEDVSDILPPDAFEFHGFTLCHAHDVTVRETLHEFKETLIAKESVTSRSRFLELENLFRKLLREPRLHMSIVHTFDGRYFRTCPLMSPEGDRIDEVEVEVRPEDLEASVYGSAWCSRQPVTLHDLRAIPARGRFEDDMATDGVVGLHLLPLVFQDECIAFVELHSPHPIDDTSWDRDALDEVRTVLAVAVHRAMSEVEAQLDRIIKLHCTSIHPCVEWRFRRVALDFHGRSRHGLAVEMPVIEFRRVFPLFGTSDIRGSSLLRKQAIADDLRSQMHLALGVFDSARAAADAPWTEHLATQLRGHLDILGRDLSAGQEISILDFLRRECEPALGAVVLFAPETADRVREYFALVENEHASLFMARARYERSVRALNTALTRELDASNAGAQKVFPHIFERHATDGAEHSVYIGEDMSERGGFSSFHLRNIRLWQLRAMAQSAAVAHRLRPELEIDLELAHLVVVQNIPITLKFFFDEKRFDVDGAYNTRYEIIKKRLDKSHVKGTRERLTQCGRMAIVYSQEAERAEYHDYLAILAEAGVIERHWEELEVDDLQGVTGLRALRVRLDEAFLAGSGRTGLRAVA
jgi:hypothetical protein